MVVKNAGIKPARGRPRTSALPRAEQLRHAKRAQRERSRAQGLVECRLTLSDQDAEMLKCRARQPGFTEELHDFLAAGLIDVDAYENLKMLLWNRQERYLDAETAFRLYERNWRHVDRRNMSAAERALIDRLADQFGNGVLNV